MGMRALLNIVGLQTPHGRLLFFCAVSLTVYLLPVHILAQLSLWNHLGLPAPSIGLTRAYHHVLHGDFTAAYHQNRLIYAILAIGLPLLAKDAYNVVIHFKQRHSHDSTRDTSTQHPTT